MPLPPGLPAFPAWNTPGKVSMIRSMSQTSTSPGGPRHVTVSAEEAGQRIDNFLAARLKGVPRSRLYRILRKGEVRVNKGRTQPRYRLRDGDVVRIPPVRQGEENAAPAPTEGVQQRLTDAILQEEKNYLVLNKPAGLPVHGGSGVDYGVIEALRAARPEAPFLELVHRLDRETSGCLLIAKRRSWLRALNDLLSRGEFDKRYFALVRGDWDGGLVEAPLRRDVRRGGERVVEVRPDGREARTRFTPVARFGDATLMDVILYTGRTHQVRVHAAHAGHPLAGDERYGDEGFNRRMRELGLRRLFLHAHHLGVTLPDETELSVSAPLEPGLQAVIDRLEAQHG